MPLACVVGKWASTADDSTFSLLGYTLNAPGENVMVGLRGSVRAVHDPVHDPVHIIITRIHNIYFN